MKSFLRLGLIFAASVAFAQDYNGTTVPKTNDNQKDSLKKVDKVLNDSKTGVSPLNISILLSPLTQPALTTGEFNGTTVPKTSDNEVISLRKINKLLNDARTGSAPLNVLGAGGGGSVTINGTAGQVTVNTVGTTSTISIPSTLSLNTAGNGIISGSTAANGDLNIEGTTNGTKTTSNVAIQTTGGTVSIGNGNGIATINGSTVNTSAGIWNMQSDRFEVTGNVNYNDTLLLIDTSLGLFQFGDPNAIGNGTHIVVNDNAETVTIVAGAGITLSGPATANAGLSVTNGDLAVAGNITATGSISPSSYALGNNTVRVIEPRTRALTAMTLRKTVTTIPTVSAGISGVTYNASTGTLFIVRNVSGAAGNIYEITTDGGFIRTITNSNFVDTESICWLGTVTGSGTSTVYDVFAIGEEENPTTAQEGRVSICYLTRAASALDRTATNGTDPDNASALTFYSGGTINNLGLEALTYDTRRGLMYYTSEKQTDSAGTASGTAKAIVYQRPITFSGSATPTIGTETVLCDLQALYTGAVLTDISDMCYSPQDDTILVISDESDKTVKVNRATGALIEQLSTPGGQPEGVSLHPDGMRLFVTGESAEFYRYEVGGALLASNTPYMVPQNGTLNVTGTVLTTTGVGYGTGAGGTVTQITSKATSVSLNRLSGEITMNSAALTADTSVTFTLNNTTVVAGDYVAVQHVSGGTLGAYTAMGLAGGSTVGITVRNVSAGSLSEAIVLKFVVIKATNS